MKLSETAFKFAFFGMKHEANDIIDYLAMNFSGIDFDRIRYLGRGMARPCS